MIDFKITIMMKNNSRKQEHDLHTRQKLHTTDNAWVTDKVLQFNFYIVFHINTREEQMMKLFPKELYLYVYQSKSKTNYTDSQLHMPRNICHKTCDYVICVAPRLFGNFEEKARR